MKRKRWLALGAVALLLVLAAGAWATLRRAEPQRPPELFGTVEQVRDAGPHHPPMFLIRCRQPGPGVPESEQNAFQRTYLPHVWVWVRSGTPVRRGGGRGLIAAGQVVSAWCSGPVMDSMPPQWPAEFVVIDADGP